jgi:hypothetical protein
MNSLDIIVVGIFTKHHFNSCLTIVNVCNLLKYIIKILEKKKKQLFYNAKLIAYDITHINYKEI